MIISVTFYLHLLTSVPFHCINVEGVDWLLKGRRINLKKINNYKNFLLENLEKK